LQNINTTNPNTPGPGPAYQPNNSFWTIKRWLIFLMVFLLLWVGFYLFAHERTDNGYVYLKFNTQQLSQINRILFTKDEYSTNPVATGIDTPKIANDTSLLKDTTLKVAQAPVSHIIAHNSKCDDSCRVNNAMLYIRSEFDGKIKEDQLSVIKEYLISFSSEDVGVYLADLKLKVRSYFWLTGPYVYIEIVFWAIIGVVCNILFMLSNDLRIKNGNYIFKQYEIPYHLAKLVYAPFCTIVIVLSYNYIKHRNVVEVNTNEGMIVFSFIAGFFAGRVMSMLEKLKDVLFPENIFTNSNNSNTQRSGISIRSNTQLNTHILPEKIYPKIISHIEFEPNDNHTNGYEDSEIGEIGIDLKLDVSGLFEEEKTEILNRGFNSATVTLHSVNGRDVITARSILNKGQSTFNAYNIRPGIYIVRATITQKISDDYTVNLFGEKTAYFTRDNKTMDLYLKKYEAID